MWKRVLARFSPRPGQDESELIIANGIEAVLKQLRTAGFSHGEPVVTEAGLYSRGVECQAWKGKTRLKVRSSSYLTVVEQVPPSVLESKLKLLASSLYKGDQAQPGVDPQYPAEGPRQSNPMFAGPGSVEGVGLPRPQPSDELLEELDEPEAVDAMNSPPMFNLSQPPTGG